MAWIHSLIRERGGAVPFRDFMEFALYHPEHGYYRAGPTRFGRDGDFLTAPTASPWYGRALARLLDRLAAGGDRWTVVDLAAGDGSLLAELATAAPTGLELAVAVERSPTLRKLVRERLAGAAVPVEVVAELAPAPAGRGATMLHASELYDALPVHRVVRRDDGLRELWVAVAGDGLGWQERPAPPDLGAHLARHGVELRVGQVGEICLEAGPLHRSLLAGAGDDAVALVLDYGYEARRLYDSRGRREGSLVAHVRHRVSRDVLEEPGERDLTAHVNLDDLRAAAVSAGWLEVGCWSLAELLVRAGIADAMEREGVGAEAGWDARVVAERQEVKRLLDPDGMGSDLKALVQATPSLAVRVSEALEL